MGLRVVVGSGVLDRFEAREDGGVGECLPQRGLDALGLVVAPLDTPGAWHEYVRRDERAASRLARSKCVEPHAGALEGRKCFVAGTFAALHPDIERDADTVRVLRSVLMKPEYEAWIDPLHERLEELTQVSTATS
jgi:hypothetical protein